MIISNTLPSIFEQAKLSHAFFSSKHTSADVDILHFQRRSENHCKYLPWLSARATSCLYRALNPRGLQSLQLWQTDVTKYLPFGRLKNVHVSVSTFSEAVFTSLHAGETAKHACQHFLQAFTSLSVPEQIKIDNGPTYRGQTLNTLLKIGVFVTISASLILLWARPSLKGHTPL